MESCFVTTAYGPLTLTWPFIYFIYFCRIAFYITGATAWCELCYKPHSGHLLKNKKTKHYSMPWFTVDTTWWNIVLLLLCIDYLCFYQGYQVILSGVENIISYIIMHMDPLLCYPPVIEKKTSVRVNISLIYPLPLNRIIISHNFVNFMDGFSSDFTNVLSILMFHCTWNNVAPL